MSQVGAATGAARKHGARRHGRQELEPLIPVRRHHARYDGRHPAAKGWCSPASALRGRRGASPGSPLQPGGRRPHKSTVPYIVKRCRARRLLCVVFAVFSAAACLAFAQPRVRQQKDDLSERCTGVRRDLSVAGTQRHQGARRPHARMVPPCPDSPAGNQDMHYSMLHNRHY